MIFASVGTQLPFPRLIAAVDRIAALHGLTIHAQTNDPAAAPLHIKHWIALSPEAFEHEARLATVLVGHAGIGTIITAKRLGKPLVVFPRLASLREHRNDHQAATARLLARDLGAHVAWNDRELEALLRLEHLSPVRSDDAPRLDALIGFLRTAIDAAPPRVVAEP